MSLLAIIGARVLSEQDKMSAAMGMVQTDLAVMKVNIQYLRDRNELVRSSNR